MTKKTKKIRRNGPSMKQLQMKEIKIKNVKMKKTLKKNIKKGIFDNLASREKTRKICNNLPKICLVPILYN